MKPDNKRKLVNVSVATLWTAPDSPRELDEPGIGNPVDINKWLDQLTYEPRLALCDDNLVQSQLLFGEEVIVLEEKDGWSHVIVPSQPSKKDERGYPGWIPTVQLQDSEVKQTFDQTAVVTSPATTLLDENKQPLFKVSYLTELPVIREEKEYIQVKLPVGSGYLAKSAVTLKQDIPKGAGTDIIRAGEAFLDLPYFWGGMSSFGYDCSGFSYNMHKANGYQIPRDATDQAAMGGKEIPLDRLEPGDLLFFAYEEGKGKLHHVGIYYGEGKMIHSPTTGKHVEITPLAGTVYEKELCGARRYWTTEGQS
ncbi:C40 family peptidase [Sediminibacillus massiliensis]|uniref:C40 family peptidase n=1 Tax=Sediminibacillus massiliensis TaxID=1926277 RepID=UPI0009886F9A|nr:C40 family peptidase [Sediminibacillus massiliensis]